MVFGGEHSWFTFQGLPSSEPPGDGVAWMLQAEALAGTVSLKAPLGRQISHLGVKIQLPPLMLGKTGNNIGDATGIKV
jgi:hypothetical protein